MILRGYIKWLFCYLQLCLFVSCGENLLNWETEITSFNGKDYKLYIQTGINKAGDYFKIGLYLNEDANGINTLYFDNIKIGTSYSEVSP